MEQESRKLITMSNLQLAKQSTRPDPRAHALGGKVIGCVIVSTKIAISRDVGV